MLDSYKRSVDYLRISVTDKCNLRCTYCMPPEGIPVRSHEELFSFEEITAVVRAAAGLGFSKVRLTGGEPLVRKGIVELVEMLKTVPGLDFLGMTTNATLLTGFAAPLKRAGLDGINISLDTLDPARYARITRGGNIEHALAGIEAALAAGFSPIKINTVVAPETDAADLKALKEFCENKGIFLQRIRQYSLLSAKQDETQYERPPRCGECNRLRLTCDGFIKPCLHSNTEIPVDPADPVPAIREAVAAKPARGLECNGRNMVEIGG